MSNNNFTKVFPSTTSAVDGYKGASLGEVESPYKVIDVNVNLAGAVSGAVFILGDALPAGSVILQVGLNVQGLTQATADTVRFATYTADIGATQTTNPAGYPATLLANVTAAVPLSGVQTNIVPALTTPLVPNWLQSSGYAANTAGRYPVYLALVATTLPVSPNPLETGTLAVKVVYFSV